MKMKITRIHVHGTALDFDFERGDGTRGVGSVNDGDVFPKTVVRGANTHRQACKVLERRTPTKGVDLDTFRCIKTQGVDGQGNKVHKARSTWTNLLSLLAQYDVPVTARRARPARRQAPAPAPVSAPTAEEIFDSIAGEEGAAERVREEVAAHCDPRNWTPPPAEPTSALVLPGGHLVGHDGDRMNLTDLWRAAGSVPSKKPALWLTQEGTLAFIEHLEATANGSQQLPLVDASRGASGSTWAHWHLGLAYANYLDHDFHMRTNEIVRCHFGGRPAQVSVPLTNQPLAVTRALGALEAKVEEFDAKLEKIAAVIKPAMTPRLNLKGAQAEFARLGAVLTLEEIKTLARFIHIDGPRSLTVEQSHPQHCTVRESQRPTGGNEVELLTHEALVLMLEGAKYYLKSVGEHQTACPNMSITTARAAALKNLKIVQSGRPAPPPPQPVPDPPPTSEPENVVRPNFRRRSGTE